MLIKYTRVHNIGIFIGAQNRLANNEIFDIYKMTKNRSFS